MGKRDYYKRGDYNVTCDKSGQKYKASECRKEWNGLFVYEGNWEERHPQDFVRGVKEDISVPIPRPEPPPRFVDDSPITVD